MSKQSKLLQFTNCRLVRDHELIKDDLWIRDGRIVNPEPVFFDEKLLAYKKFDCNNSIIAAGYIDLQINGGYGVDFSYDTESVAIGINKVANGLITNGVTSFCPTLITSPAKTYRKVLPKIPKSTTGAGIIGVHLEGPFIRIEKRGAHPAEHIQKLDKGFQSLMDSYGTLENVKIVTLAPEVDMTGDVIKKLHESGVIVAVGHSMGSLTDGEKAVQNGATLITHLFNAMLPFHHRDPGLVGLLASDAIPEGQVVYFGIISDGVHTHPSAMRIVHRAHPNGLCLVTDAISALGLEEGIHHIGQQKLEVRDSKAFVAGTDTLCGSITPMDECVRIFKKSTGCSSVYAIEAATLHPAKCLKIEKNKGTLDFGSDADFIFLDDNLNVLLTWIDGKCVYTSDASTLKFKEVSC